MCLLELSYLLNISDATYPRNSADAELKLWDNRLYGNADASFALSTRRA